MANTGRAILVQIEAKANLTWHVAQDTRADIWIANLPALGMTVTADTFGELPEAMKEALDLLFHSLFEEGELADFLRSKDWKPLKTLPPPGSAVRFDVPFGIQPGTVRELVPAHA